MKIGLSEATARKALDLIPANTRDQDLQQLRTRIEQQLKATVNGGILVQDELAALIWAAGTFADAALQNPSVAKPAKTAADNLRTAIPKLEALLARAKAQAGA